MTFRLVPGPLRLLGTGAALPGPAIPSAALLQHIDERFGTTIARSGSRIAGRLGVRARHFCRDLLLPVESPRPLDTNPRLCARAIRQALLDADLVVDDLCYLLAHTTTPHTLLPPNAAWVADELACDAPFMELRQACCGFASALQIAGGFLATPAGRPLAIVGSETGSVFLDPRRCQTDHDQLVNLLMMGDGAGAVILGPDAPKWKHRPQVQYLFAGTLGHGRKPGIRLDAGGSSCTGFDGSVCAFQHNFSDIRQGGLELFEAGIKALSQTGHDPSNVDWILTHQASAAIPDLLARHLGIEVSRFVVDADTLGNLGSASIWVALHRLRKSGRLRDAQTVMVLGAEASKYLYGGFIYRHSTA